MSLTLLPYKKPPADRPVGVVLDSRTVVGEWVGTSWHDVPRKAALYANDVMTVKPLYDAGEVQANYWKKPGRLRSLSSWKWVHPDGHSHLIYDMRNTFSKIRRQDRLAALLGFVNFVRAHGAAPGSPSGMLHSLLRIRLSAPFKESSAQAPGDQLWRGSRIERGSHFSTEYGPTDLWDIRSAFPRALASVSVPRRWRRYGSDGTLPSAESGFARARVHVPDGGYVYGPLPDLSRTHPDFPIRQTVVGTWSLDELRVAEETGSDVQVRESWVGNSYRQPFAEWGAMVAELRAAVPESSVSMVKMAANRYVGRFAMDGHREHSRMVNGELEWTIEKGHRRPESLTVHGLVTASVRATLFRDGIYPYPFHFVFCHTDGVALMADAAIDRRPPPRETWRIKAYMERLLLLNPQRYAYRPGADDPEPWRYVVAGVPEPVAAPFFLRRWNRGQGLTPI